MIDHKSLTAEWLTEISARNRKADKILVEKVIRALLLLEGLVKTKIDFVFKGGTALMLLLKSTKRLSIDIDIIVSKPQELDERFNSLLNEQGFTRFELQKRNAQSKIKKAHYKFFYKPVHNYGLAEDYVLLDILFEEPHYQNIITLPIDSAFVHQTGDPLVVNVPSFEDILGDKLTAFAPNTTGVPYEKHGDSQAMEIIKQLYDVGSLLAYAEDPTVVASTFKTFATTELGYRDCEPDIAPVLEDIYATSVHICSRGTDGKGDFAALQKGMTQITRFIFSENYHLERAVTDAAKAAYIAKAIQHGLPEYAKFSDPSEIKDWIIDQSFNSKLNKLKKSNPEAFFYWYQIYLLEK